MRSVLPLPLLWASLRQDLRAWALPAFAACLSAVVLGAPLFDLWEGDALSARSWGLAVGTLEGGLILGMALFGSRPSCAAPRSGTADGIRGAGPGWAGWCVAEALYAALRVGALIAPAAVLLLGVYMYRGSTSEFPLLRLTLASAAGLALEAVHWGCWVVLLRRFLPATGVAVGVIAAAALARAQVAPALRALVPAPLTLDGPSLAQGAASLLAAAGALIVAACWPPEHGRT